MVYISIILVLLSLYQAGTLIPPKFQWKTIDYAWERSSDRYSALSNGSYIPVNNMPTGLARWKDKLFITVPRWKPGVPSSLNYVYLNDTQNAPLHPYPNWREGCLSACGTVVSNKTVVSTFRVHVDKYNRLWVVDNGISDMSGDMRRLANPAVLVFDLNTDELVKKYIFGRDVLRDSSMLTSIVTASINETCMFKEQCEDVYFKTECRNERCVCKFEMVPEVTVDGAVICTSVKPVEESTKTLDPAMIGVLVGMALMFIIICVVLRLFSRARWRENRTIFNTPNPRLMNVSLLRDSKLLHSQDRRGSRVSVRPPSRQASQQELRPHSPSPGSRRGSRASSGHSVTSLRSATLRSPTTPGPTSVTVEIRAPEV